MKAKYILFVSAALIFAVSCGSGEDDTVYDEQQDAHLPELDYDTFSAELVELENEILNTSPRNKEKLKEAVTKFQDFASHFPDDPEAPNYLLKASDFALELTQYEKSIKILDWIIRDYPDYERMEDVMFNRASHLDFEMRDTTAAKQAYQDFIAKYPSSEMVDDAEARIKYIAYSLEELPELFMKLNEEQAQ